MLPFWSSATAPTVPNLWSTSSAESFSAFSRSNASRRAGVAKYSGGVTAKPFDTAKSSAPLPTRNTCSLCVRTVSASRIGFLTV